MTALGRDPAFLSFFWALASDDAPVRQEAAVQLVHYTLNSLRSASSGDEKKKKKNSDSHLSDDAEYAFMRLVKGLGSSRNSARRGFAAALCELLSQPAFHSVDMAQKVLSITDKNSQVSVQLQR